MRIIIADKNEIVRESFSGLIEQQSDMTVSGYAKNGVDAVLKTKAMNPDVILIDSGLPILNGLDTSHLIHTNLPYTKIIILSLNKKEEFILKSFSTGALGFVFKLSPSKHILDAIRTTTRGNYFISPDLNQETIVKFINSEKTGHSYKRYDLLTNREQQIFRLIVEGNSSSKIARQLCLCRYTVEKYKKSICEKINIYDKISLEKFATNIGIIDNEVWSKC